MSTPTADPQLLAGLVPMSALSAEHLRQLAARAVIEELPAGHLLFEEGGQDPEAYYVLAGEVQLSSHKAAASVRAIRSPAESG